MTSEPVARANRQGRDEFSNGNRFRVTIMLCQKWEPYSHPISDDSTVSCEDEDMTTVTTTAWEDAVKKEARGHANYDLGEVQDTGTYYVHTERGGDIRAHRTQFYIPKSLVESYDGKVLRFNVSATEAPQFVGTAYPTDAEYLRRYAAPIAPPAPAPKPAPAPVAPVQDTSADVVERIPLIAEHLNVNKHLVKEEVVITKVPYIETLTRDVPLMHQEVTIEERRVWRTVAPNTGPVTSPEDFRVSLEHEAVDVTKTPEVTEELIVRRKPVTETVHISEQVKSEKFKTTGKVVTTKSSEEEKELEA